MPPARLVRSCPMGIGEALVATTGATLAVVLAWSGSAKIRYPFPAALAMVRFGLVGRIRRVNGRAAGVIELAFAAWLVTRPMGQLALLAAALLSLIFCVIVGRALFRGDHFDCGCFGKEASPLSWVTLLRAGTLFLAAVAAAIAVPVVEPASLTPRDHALIVALGVMIVVAVSLAGAMIRERPFTKIGRPLTGLE